MNKKILKFCALMMSMLMFCQSAVLVDAGVAEAKTANQTSWTQEGVVEEPNVSSQVNIQKSSQLQMNSEEIPEEEVPEEEAPEEVSPVTYTFTVKDPYKRQDPTTDLYTGKVGFFYMYEAEGDSRGVSVMHIDIVDGIGTVDASALRVSEEKIDYCYLYCDEYGNTPLIDVKSFELNNIEGTQTREFGTVAFQYATVNGYVLDEEGNPLAEAVQFVEGNIGGVELFMVLTLDLNAHYKIAPFGLGMDDELTVKSFLVIDDTPKTSDPYIVDVTRQQDLDTIIDLTELAPTDISYIEAIPVEVGTLDMLEASASFFNYDGTDNKMFVPMGSDFELLVAAFDEDGNAIELGSMEVQMEINSIDLDSEDLDILAEINDRVISSGTTDEPSQSTFLSLRIGEFIDYFELESYNGSLVFADVHNPDGSVYSGELRTDLEIDSDEIHVGYGGYANSYNGEMVMVVPSYFQGVNYASLLIKPTVMTSELTNSQLVDVTYAATHTNEFIDLGDMDFQEADLIVRLFDKDGNSIDTDSSIYFNSYLQDPTSGTGLPYGRSISSYNQGVYYFASLGPDYKDEVDLFISLDDGRWKEVHEVALDGSVLDVVFNDQLEYSYVEMNVVDNDTGEGVEGAYIVSDPYSASTNIYIPENNDNMELEIEFYNSNDELVDTSKYTPTSDVYDSIDSESIVVDGLSIDTLELSPNDSNSEARIIEVGSAREYINIINYSGDVVGIAATSPEGEGVYGYKSVNIQYVYLNDHGNRATKMERVPYNILSSSNEMIFSVRDDFIDLQEVNILVSYVEDDTDLAYSKLTDITGHLSGSNSFIDLGDIEIQHGNIVGRVVDTDGNPMDVRGYGDVFASKYDDQGNLISMVMVDARIRNGLLYMSTLGQGYDMADIVVSIMDQDYNYIDDLFVYDLVLNNEAQDFELVVGAPVPAVENMLISINDEFNEMIPGVKVIEASNTDGFVVYVPTGTLNAQLYMAAFDADGQFIQSDDVSITMTKKYGDDTVNITDEFVLSTTDIIGTNNSLSLYEISINEATFDVRIINYDGQLAMAMVNDVEGNPVTQDMVIKAAKKDDNAEVFELSQMMYFANDLGFFVLNDIEDELQNITIRPLISSINTQFVANTEVMKVQSVKDLDQVQYIGNLNLQSPTLFGEVSYPNANNPEDIIVTRIVGIDQAGDKVQINASIGGNNYAAAPFGGDYLEEVKVSVDIYQIVNGEYDLTYNKDIDAVDINAGLLNIELVDEDRIGYVPTPTPTPNPNPGPVTGGGAPVVNLGDEATAQEIPSTLVNGVRTIFSNPDADVAIGNVKEFVNGKNKELVAKLKVASLRFDKATLAGIAKATSEDVEFEAKLVENKDLSTQIKALVGNNKVYDFNVTAGDNKISKFDGSVTVSIPYTLKTSEDPDSIVVYYINDDGALEIVTNCTYADGVVTFRTSHFSMYMIGHNKKSFNDVKGWYVDYVEFLAARDIMNGTGDNAFNPTGVFTRAEAIQTLANLSGDTIAKATSNPFNDVEAGKWYADAVAWAKAEGLAVGSEGNFDPMAPISRQDLAVLITRYVENFLGSSLVVSADAITFNDASDIKSYASDAVTKLQRSGIVSGTPEGEFLPKNNASRAEAAKIFSELLKSFK